MDIPGAWLNDEGNVVLWSIPKPPTGFLNISFDSTALHGNKRGIDVLGRTRFRGDDFPLISIFRKNVAGNAEEFLVGITSVILITVLSEIVQVILMRRRKQKKGGDANERMWLAFLVDELYHLRDVVSHMRNIQQSTAGPRGKSNWRFSLTTIFVIFIGFSLMAADVFVILLTQPISVYSSNKNEYNLQGTQPVGTDQGKARWITRLFRNQPCVTPTFTPGGQKREFSLSPCVSFEVQKAHTDVTDVVDEITVRSFYHKGGSDHRVIFGDASIRIKKRVFLYANHTPARRSFIMRMTFEPQDTQYVSSTRYIHELFIYSVMEVNCNHAEATVSCERLVNDLQASSHDHKVVEEEIEFWDSRKQFVKLVVPGLESTFRISVDNPFTSIDGAIDPLVASSAIREVRGPGTYVNFTHEQDETDVRGLISEEGRVAGPVALVCVVAVLVFLLIILRLFLKPISFPALAWEALVEKTKVPSEHLPSEPLEPSSTHSDSAMRRELAFEEYC